MVDGIATLSSSRPWSSSTALDRAAETNFLWEGLANVFRRSSMHRRTTVAGSHDRFTKPLDERTRPMTVNDY
jgi:hypothetical protein